MIAVLTGLADEAAILRSTPGLPPAPTGGPSQTPIGDLRVFCGAAERDTLAKLVGPDCRGLVSFGVAGAMAPDLAVGALVTASGVTLPDGTYDPSDFAWMKAVALAARAEPRPFFSSPTEQAATAAARAALHASLRVDVVDEETFAVAQLAAARRLPWIAVRAISDLASETLPPADAGASRPNGSTDLGEVIGSVLADPGELGGLITDADGYSAALDALRQAWDKLKPEFLIS